MAFGRDDILAVRDDLIHFLVRSFHKMFPMGEEPNYEPDESDSIAARAEREGRRPELVVIDSLLEQDGHALNYFPIMNYTHGNLDDVRSMMTHPHTLFGLSDAGAHCGVLCDASFPTTTLTHWGRDRTRGDGLPLPWLIHGLTQKTARQVGMEDRGVLAPGYLADVNVLDFDALRLRAPEIISDLPAEGRRLVQRADGYRVTIKSGAVAFRDGEAVEQDPARLRGRLVRGAQAGPA